MVVEYSLDNISLAAEDFLRMAEGHKIFAFEGGMGAGKTTFITALCKALGVTEAISSPTFSIINEYEGSGALRIYHLDLYRLQSEQEAIRAGVEECFYDDGAFCFVEWPSKAPALLPEQTTWCYIEITGSDKRNLAIKL